MELQSERLRIRKAQHHDLNEFHMIRNSESFLTYNPVPPSSIEETQVELDRLISEEWMYTITLKDDDKMIGIIDVMPDFMRYGIDSVNVSYSMDKQFAGRGYMTEALQLMITYIFKEMKKEVIAARVFKGNSASINLMTKLGFTQEGTLRKCVKGNGNIIYDDCVFSLLREEWAGK